jgi:hypothetical protein
MLGIDVAAIVQKPSSDVKLGFFVFLKTKFRIKNTSLLINMKVQLFFFYTLFLDILLFKKKPSSFCCRHFRVLLVCSALVVLAKQKKTIIIFFIHFNFFFKHKVQKRRVAAMPYFLPIFILVYFYVLYVSMETGFF